MTLERDIELLKSVPFFAGIPAEPLKLIAFSADSREVPDGRFLFTAGDPAEGGFIVVNPALLPAEGLTWEAYMRMSGAMLAECAEVCFLPDWKESKGAKYEFGEAMAQNKPFFFFADWEREGSQNAEK